MKPPKNVQYGGLATSLPREKYKELEIEANNKKTHISILAKTILTEYTKKTENPEFDDSTDKLIQIAEKKPEQKVSLSMANVDINCVIIIEATAEAYGLSIAAIVRLIILDYLSKEEIPNVHTEDTTDDIKDTKDISHEE